MKVDYITVFDKLMADTVGITVEQWKETTDELDEDQLNYITSKLSSMDDNEVEEGIQAFNRI